MEGGAGRDPAGGKKIAPPGGTTRKVWVYRMTDADGRVVCEGTAVELVEKAFYPGRGRTECPPSRAQ